MRRVVRYTIGLLVLWACDAAAKDIPISSDYVLKKQDSCPDVGYYFRREPSPNAVDPGPCFLCFCKEPGTAACWPRESKQCDVENFTLNTSNSSDLLSRKRRSPLGFGDIFFRDATRDFFDKNLPQQCKPNDESFSDGCPPADWCLGCTVCDCDANGRWDCHVLSFCNEEEREKQLKKGKLGAHIIPKPPKKNTKPQATTKKPVKTTKKPVKTTKKPVKTTKKPINTTKKPVKPVKQTKPANPDHKPAKRATKPTKPTEVKENKPRKKVIKRVVKKVNNDNKKHTRDTKPPKRSIIIKKPASKKTIKQMKENPKEIHSKKLTQKEIHNESERSDRGQVTFSNREQPTYPPNMEYEMGQALVKRVMASVQKMVKSELDRINKTAIEKGLTSTDCEHPRKKKKENLKDYKYKRIGQEFRWMRSKREIGNESTTSIYDGGIATTTDLNTGTSVEIVSSTTQVNANDLINTSTTTTTNINLSSNIILNNVNNFDGKVLPLDSTTEINLSGYKNMSNNNNNLTVLNFQIVVNDDQNETDQNIAKNALLNVQSLGKLPSMSSFKYNIQNELIDNSITNETAEKPNTLEEDQNKEVNISKNETGEMSGTKKYGFIKKLITKAYRNISDIYFPSKNITGQRKVESMQESLNKTRKAKKNHFLKYIKNILQKLMYIGNRPNRLRPEDEYEIVKILCGNIKSCKITKRNRKILRYKIKKLNAETKTIFKTIKIIKGLLRLIDIPELNNNATNFKSDIKKLNAILKNNITVGGNTTTTVKTQISYLKTNTKTFIMSVTRFTNLVNEITRILQRNNKKEVTRDTGYTTKNMTDSFEKIKKILIKHKLVENTFMKKIYTLLTDLEVKVANKTKVSDKRINSYVINKYSRDIIDNLRKLRDLAQTLNSSRKKRQITGDDDTMEYLLILLEYLLKKDAMATQAGRTEPVVHDGIDVLIDTIKNAPDIKEVKKKALENAPRFPNLLQAANARASDENDTAILESNQASDSGSISNENNSSRLNDILIELRDEALKGDFGTETPKANAVEDQSQNIRGNFKQESALSAKDNPYHKPVQDESGKPHREPTKDVSGIPYHDPAPNDNLYHDLAQGMKTHFYNDQQNLRKLASYEDLRPNHKESVRDDKTQILTGDVNVKVFLNDKNKKPAKDSISEENIRNLKDDSNSDGSQNLKNNEYSDASEKETQFDENTPDTKDYPNKDMIITKYRTLNDFTPKVISNEEITQILPTIPFEDISQKVYYEKVDENATIYESSYENVTIPVETTTKLVEKIGFDKFENSLDRLESDSDEDVIPTNNTKPKIKDNKNKRNQTGKYIDSDQSDSTGNLEWIEENFGKELRNLKEKFDMSKEKSSTSSSTTAKPVAPTLTSKVTQALDLSDASDENDGKKDKKLSAEEVMYRKQMNLLNSLDYGTEKAEFEDTKSEDDAADSIYA